MTKNKNVLSRIQSANVQALMYFEDLTYNQARYASLREEQLAEFKQQTQNAKDMRRLANPRREMLLRKEQDANRRGLEFTLTEDNVKDWPDFCPVTGVKLRYDGINETGRRGPSDDTAAFDRVDNTRGYVPDNVVIVSNWVNTRKGDATPEQLRRIADFYSRASAH
jgi:hypothetical protein